jgi:hypothetical protein
LRVVRGPLPRLIVYFHRLECISSVSVRFENWHAWHALWQLFSLCSQLRGGRW